MRTTPLPGDNFPFDHAYIALDDSGVTAICGDPDQVFPLASVTKPMAAWAILIAVAQGQLSLEAPAGPEGSTIAHLLAHASGVGPDPTVPIGRVGAKRIYTNYGYDLLADAFEREVGVSAQAWMEERLFAPLGMATAQMRGSIAKDARGSADDVAKFAAELLSPTLLPSELVERATTPFMPGLSGIVPGYGRHADCQWGLGLEIRDHKSPHWTGSDFSPETFGHFGQSGSFVFVDPAVRKAGVFVGAQPFGEIHQANWPALTNAMRAL
ncbi:CubicO group peptidase (beta-lactamase class C family) [Arcanobacterium wilhelmae]|uniref:CubicO group peptidase (Beta-lactamase class C family) n=1 Tax=Arcanobacterium wilhelmae TaxID=1803177 RepID=A0ABT9NBV1_9ACTO|nr:serine hydrolase domain-containing protein [Arcanobacterium wilhelmae]MDP9800691.1 CubicO group peptidase (beta-lactamase class C family) [Arcanobacterium wilhelmae]